MRKVRNTLFILLTLLTTSLFAQDYTIKSDKDLGAPFDDYKTYAWAKQVNTSSSLVYALNDAILKSKIQHAVAHELAARDHTMSTQNPDILVNFRVFDKPVTITSYKGYFRDANYWGTDEVSQSDLALVAHSSSTGALDRGTENYFEAGTLLVQIVDAKKGVVVWQGYASGLLDGNVFDKNPDHVSKAINLIFEEYDLVLDEQ
jgi:hypothetical protein